MHLGKGGTAHVLPEFTGGMEWYEAYGQLHPYGHEVVLCVSGRMTLVQEFPDGKVEKATIGPGDFIINEPGVWHTADVDEAPAVAVFITAGEGTQHRPRQG